MQLKFVVQRAMIYKVSGRYDAFFNTETRYQSSAVLCSFCVSFFSCGIYIKKDGACSNVCYTLVAYTFSNGEGQVNS